MLKKVSNIGQILSKKQQQSINGGAYYCIIYTYNDLIECQELGGEIVWCAHDVECAPD